MLEGASNRKNTVFVNGRDNSRDHFINALTRWDPMVHICVCLVDHCWFRQWLVTGLAQIIILITDDLLQTFEKIHSKISFAESWPLFSGLDVLLGHGEFPSQRPVTRSFGVFFELCLNKRLSKHSWGWWFETRPLWRLRNGSLILQNTV